MLRPHPLPPPALLPHPLIVPPPLPLPSRRQQLSRTRSRLARDPECTFVPAINPASKALRSRSVSDMSRGDALKKETATRLLRLRLEQEGLEGVTFKPAINDSCVP